MKIPPTPEPATCNQYLRVHALCQRLALPDLWAALKHYEPLLDLDPSVPYFTTQDLARLITLMLEELSSRRLRIARFLLPCDDLEC